MLKDPMAKRKSPREKCQQIPPAAVGKELVGLVSVAADLPQERRPEFPMVKLPSWDVEYVTYKQTTNNGFGIGDTASVISMQARN